MWDWLQNAPRHLFFTGKGGVGKTSLACASALALADAGRRVLLVSTDPASNLDEVLGVALESSPKPVPGTVGLSALNLDPQAAAQAYRERMVNPFRGKLPEALLRSMEEQLSGACTTEIAAFDEFVRLLATRGDQRSITSCSIPRPPDTRSACSACPGAWTGFLEG
jgi:arsenite-transporting ATPase